MARDDDGMMWLFFTKKARFDLAAASSALEKLAFQTAKKRGKLPIVTATKNGIEFRLRLMDDGDVAELRAMAGKSAPEHRAKLRSCDAGIEILFDERNKVLDEINSLIEIQVGLRDASGGWLYLGWNCVLQPPEL